MDEAKDEYPDKSDIQQEANEVRQGQFEVWLNNCDKNDLINLIGEDLIKERWLSEIENE